MKICKIMLMVLSAGVVVAPLTAIAQQMPDEEIVSQAQMATNEEVASPPAAIPFENLTDDMQQPLAQGGGDAAARQRPIGFPLLPPATPCKKNELAGAWKLVNVYESPAGIELSNFNVEPSQYIRFTRESTFKTYKDIYSISNSDVLQKLERTATDKLQQFVIDELGFLFLYTDGVVEDTQACFIVAADRAPFTKAQMLLMPPAPQEGQRITSRLLKVYTKIWKEPRAREERKAKDKSRRTDRNRSRQNRGQ